MVFSGVCGCCGYVVVGPCGVCFDKGGNVDLQLRHSVLSLLPLIPGLVLFCTANIVVVETERSWCFGDCSDIIAVCDVPVVW